MKIIKNHEWYDGMAGKALLVELHGPVVLDNDNRYVKEDVYAAQPFIKFEFDPYTNGNLAVFAHKEGAGDSLRIMNTETEDFQKALMILVSAVDKFYIPVDPTVVYD